MHWLSWDLNLKVRLFGEGIFHIFMWMVFPFMALHFTEAFGKDTTGLLLMIPPLLGIFASLIGGQLSDRIGRRPAMIFGSALESSMFLLFALSSSPWLDYLAFIGITIASSIYWPASAAMVTDLTTEEERREVFATFYTTMNIGVVFGPVIGSIFFNHHRTGLFVVCTIVSLMLTTLLFFLIKESLPPAARNKQQASTIKEQWQSYAVIFRDKIFALYILAGILVAIVFMQLDLYMGVYIKEHVPEQTLFTWGDWSITLAPMEVFGSLVGLNGLLVVLFTLPVTRLFDHWSDRNALILSSLLSGLGMFAMGLTVNVWLLFGCIMILTLGELIRTPVAQTFVSKYAPEESRGQYMGASTLQFSIGRFLAPAAIGLSQWLPPLGVFGLILLCAVISAILYLLLFRVMETKGAKQTQANPHISPESQQNKHKTKPEVV